MEWGTFLAPRTFLYTSGKSINEGPVKPCEGIANFTHGRNALAGWNRTNKELLKNVCMGAGPQHNMERWGRDSFRIIQPAR